MARRPVHEAGAPAQPAAHAPVLVERCTDLLAVRGASEAGAVLVDATIGAGGHAAALLAASGPGVHLVGFDRDADALALAGRRLSAYRDRLHLVHAPYDELAAYVAAVASAVGPVLGVLYDLGVSSMQLDTAGRGFSFRADAPLDMRMDPSGGPTAADLVNTVEPAELLRILRAYGEERAAARIVPAIVAARPVTTTGQLAGIVAEAVPAALRRGPVHPATKTFQALRIAVNGELERFGASLPQALELLAPPAPAPPDLPGRPGDDAARGGRVAVISYHSLEDRIAKRVLADAVAGCVCPPGLPVCGCGRSPLASLLTRGAEKPSDAEVERNPRARSARLRAAEKLAAAKVE